jgi:hypothetical protein
MKRLLWELRILQARSGWWPLPVVAGLFSAVFYLLMILPAQSDFERASQHHVALVARQAATPAQAKMADAESAMLQSLPSYRTLPQSLSAIFATAREMDVILDMGDYRYIRNHGESFGRYQVELPVIADYPTLRALVVRLMNQMPYASLDDISLMREAADTEVVEARLRLTLFLVEK